MDSEDFDTGMEGRAAYGATAKKFLTAPPSPDLIAGIRLAYRLAKAAERTRIGAMQRLNAYIIVHVIGADPQAEGLERKKLQARAGKIIKAVETGEAPADGDEELLEDLSTMTQNVLDACDRIDDEIKLRRKQAEALVRELPAWERLKGIRGFSEWGLAAIVGEAGDVGQYSGCRKLYKRLGLAPAECYSTGEKRGGRMIPRSAHGRLHGIIADALLKAQLGAERGPNGETLKKAEKGRPENKPRYPKGPYGRVYIEANDRHKANDRKDGHAHALAMRAMLKALLHDVHRVWHGLEPDYV